VLIHCFAGCAYLEIIRAIEARQRGNRRATARRPSRRSRRSKAIGLAKPPPRIAVAALAKARKLPVGFLAALGVRNLPFKNGIDFPYRDERGGVMLFKRRLYLDLTDAEQRAGLVKFRWPSRTPLVAYGLWLLKLARRAKRLVLVEGESDCWTLWLHAIPALGIPGADAARTLKAQHLVGIKELLIVQEADDGGAKFIANVSARLRELGFKGKASIFEMAPLGAKDLSDLYLLHPPKNFKGWFASWLR
jgi:DNA primase